MTTKTEAAYSQLHAMFQALAETSDACPDEVSRNASVSLELQKGRTGAYAILNFVDGSGRLLAEEVTEIGDEGHYELVQMAALEIALVEPDPAVRDARMDEILQEIAQFFTTLDPTLGGLVSHVEVPEPPERMVLAVGGGAVRAVRVPIEITLSAPTIFG